MQVLTKYHAEIKSFPLSESRVGLMRPGRYSGFDVMSAGTSQVGIPIKIGASSSSVRSTSKSNTANPYESTVLTPHGVVIKTSEDAQLSVSVNNSLPDSFGTTTRYDVVYLEYLWEDLDDPTPPFIGILEGTVGAGIPSMSTVTKVRLGVITVPAGSTTISSLTYTPDACPLPGDLKLLDLHSELDTRYARLTNPNYFYGTLSVEPLQVDFDQTGDVVIYTGGVTNHLYITNNWKKLTLSGIEVTPGVPHPAGTRMTLFIYNIASNSSFKRSTNGHPPGFDYNTQGIFGGSSFPIKNGDMFEVILDPGGTWRIIGAIDAFGGRLLTLWDNLNTVMHKVSDPIVYTLVSENATSDPMRFTSAYTSTYAAILDRLRVGINRAGLLEVTGDFMVVNSVSVGWNTIFTLAPGFNMSRRIYFLFIRGSENLGSSMISNQKYGRICLNGDVQIYWDTLPSVANGNWNMNVMVSPASSVAPSGGGLPSLW